MELALEEAFQLNSAVLNSAMYLIVATDEHGVVLVFNNAAEKALGYKAEEIINKQTPVIWHNQEEIIQRTEVLNKEFNTYFKPGFETFVYRSRLTGLDMGEWTFIRKDGSSFPVMVTVTPIRKNSNEIRGYLGIIEDITEKKKVEQIKNEFISMVSHELRTPLTSIQGALSLINLMMNHEITPKCEHLFDIARRNTDRLFLLINDILDMDMISKGQMAFVMRRENLVELVRLAVDAHDGYAKKFQINLTMKTVAESIPVYVDAHRLSQVFANLLSNATKFSAVGEEVLVSISYQDKRFVKVEIQDNGIGIAEEFRDKIFQRFSQADSSVSRKIGGTGLGLYICKLIMERLNGDINYKSVPGQGLHFG